MNKQLTWGALAGLVGVAGGALADGGAATAGSVEGAAEGAPQRIVVTAQRRNELAADVGVALSVLSGQDLEARGVTKVNDLQNQVTGLEVEPAFGSGQPEFRLRGVGFHDYASNNTSTVLVNVDDVSYGLPILTQGLLFDIDRVEVLRGPQGTLYGRNTTGGAVNFITRKPTVDFQSGVSLQGGNHGSFGAEAFLSGPLSDTVRGRIAVSTEQGGAWQYNRDTGAKLGNADRTGVRGLLDWDVAPDFSLRFDVHVSQDQSDGQGLYLFKPLATANGTGPTIPADIHASSTGWGLRDAFADLEGIARGSKPFKDNQGQGGSVTANWDLGHTVLTSITSYEHFRRHELNDWDASASAEADEYFRSEVDALSQELRWASNVPSDRLEWVTGVFYSKERLKEHWASDFTNVYGFAAQTAYHQTSSSLGLFGQVGYKLDSENKLIVGLRDERESRDLRDFTTTTVPVVGIGVGTPTDRSLDRNAWSGKLGLEHRLSGDTLLYASFSKGVKSGGFTAYNTLSVDQLTPFKPETLYALEAGLKSSLSRDLFITAAVYHYDYRDQQVQSAIYDTTFGPIGKIINAPKSKINGLETELQWQPLSGLTVSQSVSYKEGEYKRFNALDVSASVAAGHAVYTDLAGSDLNFPKLSYGGAVAYTWTAGSWRLTAASDYSYHDKYNSWLGHGYDTPRYWLTNANLTVGPVDAKWTVSLWGRNIFDQRYDLTRNFFTNAQVAAAGKPATYGVRVNVPF